jgi:uncharacterized membrane protein YfcA
LVTEILDLTLLLGATAALVSAMVQGYSGFGGGLVIVPILAVLFSPLEAVAIAAIGGIAGNITVMPGAVRAANWREAAPVSIAVAVAIPLALNFLISADPALIRRGMGVFTLAAAAVLMTGWMFRGRRSVFTSLAAGAVTGGIPGGFGIPGGPFMVVYYLSAPAPPPVQRANIIVTSTIGISFLIIGLIAEGAYDQPNLIRGAIIAPLFLAGIWIGRRIFQIAPAAWFKKVTYAILIATGIMALVI